MNRSYYQKISHAVWAILALLFIFIAPASKAGTYGICSLDKVDNNKDTTCVALRLHWADVEKTKGVYDFSALDKVARDAKAAGEKVTIASIMADEPGWFLPLTDPANQFQGTQSTDVMPYDPVSQQYQKLYAEALCSHTIDGVAVKDDPNIWRINAPLGSAQGVRFLAVPKTGYTQAKLIDGVKVMFANWDAACHGKPKHLGVFNVADGIRTDAKKGTTSSVDLIKSVMSTYKVDLFNEFWTEKNSTVTTQPQIATASKYGLQPLLQACWFWSDQNRGCFKTGGDSMQKAFDNAIGLLGVGYFELYQPDTDNPANAAIIKAASDKIKATFQ
jgi:hypothetical protein